MSFDILNSYTLQHNAYNKNKLDETMPEVNFQTNR